MSIALIVLYPDLSAIFRGMDLSHLSQTERANAEMRYLREAAFECLPLDFSGKAKALIREIESQFCSHSFFRLKAKVAHETFIGSLGKRAAIETILNNVSFQQCISELSPGSDKITLEKEPRLVTSLYSFLGDICTALQFGGAYTYGTHLPPDQLTELVLDFIPELLPQGFSGYHYCFIYDAWTPWFDNVAWDYTFLFLSVDATELAMLCLTDTD